MKQSTALFLSLAISATTAALARDASACGGCFVKQSENTQVSGHRMILSVSPEATTLWDQITYSGDPESFAWVLPIKGTVDIGLSSDALFQVLDQTTAVVVSSPLYSCPNSCDFSNGSGGFGGAGGGNSDPGVEVLEQEVVGPYETVQLSAQDPQALSQWLGSHGYNVPSDVQPVIDMYVAEQFNFLALKLVPGFGVKAMRPVRITTAGAGPALPLRMVAAGTGAVTPILLWVFGEGRYEPTNFPSFTIPQDQVTWNWNTQSSNYTSLRQQKLDASNGYGWLVEDAETMATWQIADPLQYGEGLIQYEDENGMNAQANLDADLAALYGNISESQVFVTRMFAQLSRPALSNDLLLGASADQGFVDNNIEAESTIGEPPCPPDPCAGEGNSGGSGGWSGPGGNAGGNGSGNAGGGNAGGNNASGGNAGGNNSSSGPGGSGGCSFSAAGAASPSALAALALGAAALAMTRRRRRP